MSAVNPFNPTFWIDNDPDCVKYDHEPSPPLKHGPEAVKQASYSAIAVEEDRSVYADLMRRRTELKADLAIVENQLENLDVLRILNTHS